MHVYCHSSKFSEKRYRQIDIEATHESKGKPVVKQSLHCLIYFTMVVFT